MGILALSALLNTLKIPVNGYKNWKPWVSISIKFRHVYHRKCNYVAL